MSSANSLTPFAQYFLQPSNATHRQYEALRGYFVEGLSVREVSQRWGYTPGSFRVLACQFRKDPQRLFFLPAANAVRSLLALKLFGNARHSHVMSYVLDEGLALFAGLNVIPKRSFLADYSCRVDPACYPKLMRHWFDAVSSAGLPGGSSFDL